MFHWTVHLNGGPKGSSFAAVAVEHEVYYFGGVRDGYMKPIDVHVLNTVSLCWRKLPGQRKHRLDVPTKREGHTAVLMEDTIYIWGGRCPYCNVLHAFDVDTHRWSKPRVSGTVPEGRNCHSACVLGKVMYVHGGRTNHYVDTNDIYKLDTNTMVWSFIDTRGTAAPASKKHSATIIGTKMFVFGGTGNLGGVLGQVYHRTIRVFDTETNFWLDTPSAKLLPKGRKNHSAFTYNGELFIFSGFNDLLKFSPETLCWKTVRPKGEGPFKMKERCCMLGDRIILFGGDHTHSHLYILDMSPSLKTLCKLAVVQYDLEMSKLPHNIRWELAAITDTEEKKKDDY